LRGSMSFDRCLQLLIRSFRYCLIQEKGCRSDSAAKLLTRKWQASVHPGGYSKRPRFRDDSRWLTQHNPSRSTHQNDSNGLLKKFE
jgi:hypothetical protein